MKRKIIISILALTMMMSVSACASETENTIQTQVSQNEVTDKEPVSDTSDKKETSEERNEYGLTDEEMKTLVSLVKEKVTEQYLKQYSINPADFTFPEYVPANYGEAEADNLWANVEASLRLVYNGSVYDLPPIVTAAETAGMKEMGTDEIAKAINTGTFVFKDSWQEQNETGYQWYNENDPQEGALIGAVYEGIAAFLNGLDTDERVDVLYETYAKNVYDGGEDGEGRSLHTMFDQVLCNELVFD